LLLLAPIQGSLASSKSVLEPFPIVQIQRAGEDANVNLAREIFVG